MGISLKAGSVVTSVPAAGVLADYSGSVTAGGTAQVAAPPNAARRYLLIVNLAAVQLWVDFGATAVADKPSIPLAAAASDGTPGGSLVFEGSFVPAGFVSVIGATTGKKFVIREG